MTAEFSTPNVAFQLSINNPQNPPLRYGFFTRANPLFLPLFLQ